MRGWETSSLQKLPIWAHPFTRRQSDWDLPFGSPKSGKKMSVNFWWNADEKNGMKPSRTIRIPHPKINRNRMSNCDIFDSVSRGFPWHGNMKSESENQVGNLRGRKIFNNAERENNFDIEK